MAENTKIDVPWQSRADQLAASGGCCSGLVAFEEWMERELAGEFDKFNPGGANTVQLLQVCEKLYRIGFETGWHERGMSQCGDEADAMFRRMYPHEAYADDPDGFWEWFHEQHPNTSRAEMETMLKETKESPR